MTIRFKGLIAPTEVPTGDGRMFAAGKMTTRPLPIPLLARFGSGGHDGAVPVGNITRIFDGPGGYWCEGEFFDPGMVQEVPKAVYLLKKKALGPSVDLDRDFTVESIPHPVRPDKKAGIFKEYNVIGITLVPMPAFHQVHMAVDDGTTPEQPKEPTPVILTENPGGALLASALLDNVEWSVHFDAASAHLEDEWTAFDVNSDSWRNWPIAPREYTFDADDAVKRIAYWSGIGSKTPNINAYASTFLWRNGNQAGDTLAQDSFRLPLADIVNGEPHLVYHAVYSAAALLSGGHGGIPMIPDADKALMVRVINEIYSTLSEAFQDPNLKSPFLVGVRAEQMAIESGLDTEDCGCNNDTAIGASIEGNDPLAMGSDMSQTITVDATGGNVTYSASSNTISPATVTVTFTPAGLPMDVLKSMQEEKRPYGDDGCHFNEDGHCEKCGY